MKLRSLLGSILLATAPLAGAQNVDQVIVRALSPMEPVAVIGQTSPVSDETARELRSGRVSTEAVTRELDAKLEQRFGQEGDVQLPPQRLLVSAN